MRKRTATRTAAVLASLVGSSASGAEPAVRPAGKGRPIADTHIHLYKVTRPGGVPWPAAGNKVLYRDTLPADYKALAKRHGVISSGIVEASPDEADNQAVLEMVKGDKFFPFLVAQIDMGAPDFIARLDKLARDPRVVGVRAFLWRPTLILDDNQLANVRAVAARGMTLDLVSRGTLNPKDRLSALARAVPDLRIVVDHMAGAKGATPTAEWELDMRRLADQHKNIYIKFSSYFDMYNPRSDEDSAWTSPTDLTAYKPHFDVLMTAFGDDRLIWGSNWPVNQLGGDFGKQIELAEEYLRPFGDKVRDKVMYKNAQQVYRRLPPKR